MPDDAFLLSRRRALLQAGGLAVGGLLGTEAATAAPAAKTAPSPDALSARAFGAKGDGKTDDTAAIQKALDEAGHAGGVVLLGGGTYRVDGTLSVPQSACLQGVFGAPPRTRPESGGTTLLATAGKGQENGTPFLSLATNSTLRGLTVYYPEQSNAVTPYPPTIQGSGDDCSIVDVLLLNPFYGVDFGTHPCGRHWVKSLYMQALSKGIYVAECFDVGRMEDVHVWPFWLNADAKINDYTAQHGEAFVLGRTDWEYMTNCFCIGYKTGYRFMASASGPGNVLLSQCGSDEGPASTSVLVEQSQGHAGVSFVNGQFMGRQHVEIRPENTGPVKFTACGFWGVEGKTGSMAQLRGKGQVTFNGCHFIGWAQAGDAQAPAIVAESGGLSVIACDFMDTGKTQIQIGPQVEAAVVTANRLRGGAHIANGDRAQIGLNAIT